MFRLVLGLACLALVPAYSQAQEPITLTPAYLQQNPVALPSSEVDKVATMRRDSVERIILNGYERLRQTRGSRTMTYIRNQERTRANGDFSTDTVRFAVADFAPVSRLSTNPGDTLKLTFTPELIEGERRTDEGVEPIRLEPDTTYFDSNVLDYLCIVLGQLKPERYRVPLYSDRTNSIEWYDVEVKDPSPADFLDGELAVEVTYRDPSGRDASVWVKHDRAQAIREVAAPGSGVELFMDWTYR